MNRPIPILLSQIPDLNGYGKSLVFGGDFEFYCLQLKKSSRDFQNFKCSSPVGMRVQCIFQWGWNFREFFSLVTKFWPIFPVSRKSYRICDTLGCFFFQTAFKKSVCSNVIFCPLFKAKWTLGTQEHQVI